MITNNKVITSSTNKYRLVCINRSVFIDPTEIDSVSKHTNGHYNVHFKDGSKPNLRIRHNICKRLMTDYPNLKVT